jgi:hypothetical protein
VCEHFGRILYDTQDCGLEGAADLDARITVVVCTVCVFVCQCHAKPRRRIQVVSAVSNPHVISVGLSHSRQMYCKVDLSWVVS